MSPRSAMGGDASVKAFADHLKVSSWNQSNSGDNLFASVVTTATGQWSTEGVQETDWDLQSRNWNDASWARESQLGQYVAHPTEATARFGDIQQCDYFSEEGKRIFVGASDWPEEGQSTDAVAGWQLRKADRTNGTGSWYDLRPRRI